MSIFNHIWPWSRIAKLKHMLDIETKLNDVMATENRRLWDKLKAAPQRPKRDKRGRFVK